MIEKKTVLLKTVLGKSTVQYLVKSLLLLLPPSSMSPLQTRKWRKYWKINTKKNIVIMRFCSNVMNTTNVIKIFHLNAVHCAVVCCRCTYNYTHIRIYIGITLLIYRINITSVQAVYSIAIIRNSCFWYICCFCYPFLAFAVPTSVVVW